MGRAAKKPYPRWGWVGYKDADAAASLPEAVSFARGADYLRRGEGREAAASASLGRLNRCRDTRTPTQRRPYPRQYR